MKINNFKTSYYRILIHSFIFCLVLFGLHKYVEYHFFKAVPFFHPIYSIHLFLFLSILGLFYFIIRAYIKNSKAIFTIFIIGSLVKSAIVLLFFLPLFFKKDPYLDYTVANFFIPYFLYLSYEMYLVIHLSKKGA